MKKSIKNKTFIFFTIYPFHKFYEKYGFDEIQKNGYEIKVFNILNIISPYIAKNIPEYFIFENNKIEERKVQNYEDLNQLLQSIKGFKIACLIFDHRKEYKFKSLLKKFDIEFIVYRNHLQPHHLISQKRKSTSKSLFSRFLSLREYKFITLIDKMQSRLINFFYKSFGVYKNPKYLLSVSEDVENIYKKANGLLRVNSFDYETFQKNHNLPRPDSIPNYEYFVLLANHPWLVHDFKLAGVKKSCVNKKKHKKMLNSLLDSIEKATKTKVVIAAYPKATDSENIYNGRPFVYETEQLVKYSKGVIGHHTGAWNFAVLHKKPMCLITVEDSCDEFKQINLDFSFALGIFAHPIDTNLDRDKIIEKGIFSYNQDSIKLYINQYLKSNVNSNESIASTLIYKIEEDFVA